MGLFPLFLKLEARRCIVVGAGNIAESKIRSLLDSNADVHVVAPHASEAIQALVRTGSVEWHQHEFLPADLDGAFLVIAATSSSEVNGAVFQEAQRRGVLCNAVDDPEHCDFYYGAVVRRGDLQIAISTAGHSPALAQRLRVQLEAQFEPEYATWLEQLGNTRARLFESNVDPEERKALLHQLASGHAFEAAQLASVNLVAKEQGGL
ncbi:MAG TPA: bifunctional precorrin-2 dehydrogenase/sirohydrochlorin ferrochelatase [Terriglobales bacterium]|nr:bifunctional precorrin-2 dehydrogenase/sirohydrochlorin ferrochelatase [Terriglobales bacterium]